MERDRDAAFAHAGDRAARRARPRGGDWIQPLRRRPASALARRDGAPRRPPRACRPGRARPRRPERLRPLRLALATSARTRTAAAALAAGRGRGGLGRFRRGDLIHRLLQLLPDLAPAARADGGRAPAGPRARPDRRRSAPRWPPPPSACWTTPRFADGVRPRLAAPRWRSPARRRGLPPGLAISGRIDRLVVAPDRVLVVDFKTNRPAPGRDRGRRSGLSAPDGDLRRGAARGLPRPRASRRRWSGPTDRS